ncbi:MAG: dTMP kinase [Candidatus Marsarchaeota archaeon]|jgi:dTMP kinase|nr:dTMP kinase [Candidatus Marsarchaeota archaeon]
MKGIFVCIEGNDGSGKTTQVGLLRDSLWKKGIDTSVYSYPTHDSRYGRIIRDEFLTGKAELSVEEQFLLYLLDMQADKKRIISDLEGGKVVITDRYFISTIAYQSAGTFDYEKAKAVEEIMGLPRPDVIFYIDIPVLVAFERKMKQKGKTDRFEGARSYLTKVGGLYERLYDERYGSQKWVKIDGLRTIDKIHETIYEGVNSMLDDIRRRD